MITHPESNIYMNNNYNFQKKILKEQINDLPVKKFEGRIYLIDGIKEANSVKGKLNNIDIFGFDTETRPSFKKGIKNNISLIQLATPEDAFLFRVNHTGIPDFLIRIFENSNIKKAGVAIKDDISALRKIKSFNPAGFTDLQQYVVKFGIEDKGLKKLAANILGIKISKSQQTSNWDNEILKQKQLEYAATDAWVCCEIFNKLIRLT